jgi:hypothetical protein
MAPHPQTAAAAAERVMSYARAHWIEGAEVNDQIIEETGWYVFIYGQWRWDEDSQDGDIDPGMVGEELDGYNMTPHS